MIVGMPASGKNIARVYSESKNIPYFATGDIVRAEVQKRALKPTPENTAMISTQLRGEDGMGVTKQVLLTARASGSNLALMEGMRSLPEIELIKGTGECIVIAFIAPRKLRLKRIVDRARPDDSPDAFDERDKREIAYGTAIPIALADEYILNTGSIEGAMDTFDILVQRYTQKRS